MNVDSPGSRLPQSLAMDVVNPELLEMEAKVTAARKEYLQLASSLNDLRPAVRLPPELLVEIFKHCAGFFTKPDDDDAISASLDWIWATHVCRQWRRVAIETPMLWTNLPIIQRPSYVRAFLARSGSLPLRIHGVATTGMPGLMKRGWRRILEQAHRIQWLIITIQRQGYVDHPVHPFGSFEPGSPSLPSLTRLSITIKDHAMPPLPTLFHNVNLHSPLEELSLSFIEFSSAQPLFLPTLKRLTILFDSDHVELASWRTFIGALATLKMLKVLRIEAIPAKSPTSRLPDAMITDKATLPALRHLSIDLASTGLMPAILLRHLECTPKLLAFRTGTEYPASAEIFLQHSDNALPIISSSLRSTISKMAPIRTVVISLESMWNDDESITVNVMVHGWDHIHVRRRGEDTELGNPNVLLELMSYSARPVLEEVIHDMPLSNVRFLSVPMLREEMMAVGEATWTMAFRQMTNLDTIIISSQVLLRCIAVRPGMPLLFPNLNTLQLHDINFTYGGPDVWSDVLREVLQGREAAGKRLSVVMISNPRNFTEDIAAEISKFVGVLDRDGITDGLVEWAAGMDSRSELGSLEITPSVHNSTGEDSDMDPYV